MEQGSRDYMSVYLAQTIGRQVPDKAKTMWKAYSTWRRTLLSRGATAHSQKENFPVAKEGVEFFSRFSLWLFLGRGEGGEEGLQRRGELRHFNRWIWTSLDKINDLHWLQMIRLRRWLLENSCLRDDSTIKQTNEQFEWSFSSNNRNDNGSRGKNVSAAF